MQPNTIPDKDLLDLSEYIIYNPTNKTVTLIDELINGKHLRLKAKSRDFLISVIDRSNWMRRKKFVELNVKEERKSVKEIEEAIDKCIKSGTVYQVRVNNIVWVKLSSEGVLQWEEMKGVPRYA